ncbi:hypothetical protein LTR73_001421 [Friedmanniomyces endolithicus]|nr:hypothetical protein LTR73_001421 [Friedmanniomyces endolithicus]
MEPEEYRGKNGVLDSVHEVPGARGRYNNMMDRSDMNRLGKKQELKRNFRLISIFSFMCVVMSTWVFVINASTNGLAAGGTGGFIAVYIGSSFAYFTVVLSLAEIASIAPTAGGQAGSVNLVNRIKCGASSSLFAASGLFLNTVGARYLALMEVFVAIFLVLGYVVNITVLWVMSSKYSTSEVFGSFDNGNGWSSTGFGILTAQTSALYLILGSDGAAHMAEETQDASVNVPRGMISSYLIGTTSGLVMVITFCFCFTTNDLSSVTGFAFMEIYRNATGSNGATLALTAILIILTFFSATNFVASASRQLYAFARDGGLPFSAQIAKVSARLNVPVPACIIAFAFVVLISLIALGSSVAFFAIISLQLIALFFTYIVAIGTLIYRRLRGPPLPEHRWSLGRAGLAINVFAFLYGLFALAFIVLPSTPTVTGATMNWGPVMFAGVMIFALVYYFAGGHKTYLGPVKLVKDEGGWAR